VRYYICQNINLRNFVGGVDKISKSLNRCQLLPPEASAPGLVNYLSGRQNVACESARVIVCIKQMGFDVVADGSPEFPQTLYRFQIVPVKTVEYDANVNIAVL
jgi:hypothetical protein